MKIRVLFFGELSELAGTAEIILENVESSSAVNDLIQSKYPLFKTRKYAIAVNTQLTREEQSLADGDILAFLPPFSGG